MSAQGSKKRGVVYWGRNADLLTRDGKILVDCGAYTIIWRSDGLRPSDAYKVVVLLVKCRNAGCTDNCRARRLSSGELAKDGGALLASKANHARRGGRPLVEHGTVLHNRIICWRCRLSFALHFRQRKPLLQEREFERVNEAVDDGFADA